MSFNEDIYEENYLLDDEEIFDSFSNKSSLLPNRTAKPVRSVLSMKGMPPMTFIKVQPSSKPKIIAIPKRPPLGRPVQRPVKPGKPPIFKGAPIKVLPRKRPPYSFPIDTPILWNPSKRKPPLGTKPFRPSKSRPSGTMRKEKQPVNSKKEIMIMPPKLSDKQLSALKQIKKEKEAKDAAAKKPEETKKKKWSTQKKIIVAAVVVGVLVGGFLIYKKMKS